MPQWTPDQLRAIHSPARELLCCAAAGSGKTAVLVERVFRMISEGESPESFLIVTFTNAAASEMKEKIRARLLADRQSSVIRSALDRIDLMQVSTIHSFCQCLLKEHFQLIGIDPLFRISDTVQKERLFHEAFKLACDELMREENIHFIHFRQAYDVRQGEKLVQSLHEFLMTLPDPFQWLDERIRGIGEESREAHPWFSVLYRMVQEELRNAEILLNRMYHMFLEPEAQDGYRESWKKDAELFHVKQFQAEHPETPPVEGRFATLKAARNLTPAESDWRDRYQKLRADWKDVMTRVDRLLGADEQKLRAEWANIQSYLEDLREITLRTTHFFQQKKLQRGQVDFADLEQDALRILADPACLTAVRRQYRHIFVDECQDVSAVQDAILQRLHGEENDLFMVGDIKQSIYRFRLADPTIFLRRIREYSTSTDEKKECVYLRANFRSRPEILETTNRVFRKVMKEDVTEVNYSAQDELVPGRKTEGRVPVCVDQISMEEEGPDALSALADHLTCRMRELRQQDFPGENRKWRWRDCVILMPAVSTHGPKLAEKLEKRGVPVFFDGGNALFQRLEVQTFLAMMSWVDRPWQDLPLLTALKQPPFLMTDQDLAEIRLRRPDKNVSFYEAFQACAEEDSELGRLCALVQQKQKEWQMMSEVLPLPEYIWYLYQETGYYDSLALEPDGKTRQANLRVLVQQAIAGEKNRILTPRAFLTDMKGKESAGDQRSATLLGDGDDVVRIMTVHKSKGLQFPAVFVAGLDQLPADRDASGMKVHPILGICLPYKEPNHRIARKTVADEIFSWQRAREERAERVRLLYVAMTRAQERMYMVTEKEMEPLWSMPESDYRIVAAKSYIDWVMPPLMDEKVSTSYAQASKPYEIRNFESNQQEIVENEKIIHSLKPWLQSTLSLPPVDNMWIKTERMNAGEDRTMIKRSVTSLIRSERMRLPVDREEETAENKAIPERFARKLKTLELMNAPRWMAGTDQITPAQRGTLVHRMLSQVDLAGARTSASLAEFVKEEKKRLISIHLITAEEAENIPNRMIESFLSSDLGQRLMASPEIHREWNFNLLLRGEPEMLLQGVADCVFLEEGGWVLVDYKTDRINSEKAFVEEYTEQLDWYARALEELTNLPVKEKWLYALSIEKAFLVAGG